MSGESAGNDQGAGQPEQNRVELGQRTAAGPVVRGVRAGVAQLFVHTAQGSV